ncbi:MAG: hypothetical protein NTY64_16540, partial [Deltaproteobacteria bacterium]|nr:hypothetical protein [Deltaproteobacteria bacterium]
MGRKYRAKGKEFRKVAKQMATIDLFYKDGENSHLFHQAKFFFIYKRGKLGLTLGQSSGSKGRKSSIAGG